MILAPIILALSARQAGSLQSQSKGIPSKAVTASTAVPSAPAPDQVVVKVNGEPITARDIENYLWDWRGAEVAQDLVTYHLVLAAAKKAGVSVTPKEVEDDFNQKLEEAKRQAQPGTDVEKTLRAQGFPKSRLYLKVHTDLLLDRIVLKSFAAKDFIKISTAAFTPQAPNAPEPSANPAPTQGSGQPATTVKKPDVKAPPAPLQRAKDAYDRLIKGADWGKEIAASDDPANIKGQNGSIGWRPISLFPPDTQAELRMAKVGTYTKPIQTGQAAQVFRVDALGPSASGAELEQLKKEFASSEKQKLITQIQSSAKIEQVFMGAPKPSGG